MSDEDNNKAIRTQFLDKPADMGGYWIETSLYKKNFLFSSSPSNTKKSKKKKGQSKYLPKPYLIFGFDTEYQQPELIINLEEDDIYDRYDDTDYGFQES